MCILILLFLAQLKSTIIQFFHHLGRSSMMQMFRFNGRVDLQIEKSVLYKRD